MNESKELQLRKFVVPEFVFGAGARHLAGQYARNLGAQKALVVTDPGLIAAGWTDDVTQNLADAGLSHVLFSQVAPNPRDEEVMAGAGIYQEEGCNAIVAVGGGSPMDCAKGIGIVTSNGRHILEFEGVDKVPVPGPPLICVPTTAGTGADVSQFAIITDLKRKVKIAIVSKTVVPDVALIDPVTTTTMDAQLTACTGLDALAHAVEAYVSNAASPLTDLHALEAIRLLVANLAPAISHAEDLDFRGRMMLGSLHAGLAFSNASLGATHAMAHSLGGLLDFPHGQANAILLEHVAGFNFDAAPGRYRRVGEAMGLRLEAMDDQEARAALVGELARLREVAGIGQSLGAMGLGRGDLAPLAQNALRDACVVTNPRRPTLRDIEEIYERAL